MTRAYLALGSNIGDRRAALRAAIEALDDDDVRIVARSGVYETEPVGGPPGQPPFYNQVVAAETTLDPQALLARCHAVEATLGRARDAEEVRWGPRTIDIDVLLYGSDVRDDANLTIPHPRLIERAFVLVPLCEIAPDVRIPGNGSAREALRALGDVDGVRPAP